MIIGIKTRLYFHAIFLSSFLIKNPPSNVVFLNAVYREWTTKMKVKKAFTFPFPLRLSYFHYLCNPNSVSCIRIKTTFGWIYKKITKKEIGMEIIIILFFYQ